MGVAGFPAGRRPGDIRTADPAHRGGAHHLLAGRDQSDARAAQLHASQARASAALSHRFGASTAVSGDGADADPRHRLPPSPGARAMKAATLVIATLAVELTLSIAAACPACFGASSA